MTQSNVTLVLRAETEGFSTSIRQAEHEFSTRFKRMAGTSKAGSHSIDQDFVRLGESISGFGNALKQAGKQLMLITGAVTGIGLIGRHFLEVADSTVQMAAKLDVTTSALQELRFAASQFGISTEKLDGGLSVFSKKIGAVSVGNEAVRKTFDDLGIAVLDTDGALRSVDAILGDVANLMQGMESQVERAALSTKLFGKEGGALSLLLGKGAKEIEAFRQQARDLGIVIDEELLNQAEHASTQLEVLGKIFKAHVMVAFAQFAPMVVNLSEKLIESIPSVKAFAAQLMDFKKGFMLLGEAIIGLKLIQFAKSISIAAGAFVSALGPISKFSAAILVLNKAMKGIAIGAALYTTIEALSAFKQHLDLKHHVRSYLDVQQQIIMTNEQLANTVRLSASEVEKLTTIEQIAYRERIQQAQQYWQSRLNLEARKDFMSPVALMAARENRLYLENLESIAPIFSKRTALEKKHHDALNLLRTEELTRVKRSLSDELKTYDEANTALAQLKEKRREIALDFRQLQADILAPQKKSSDELTVLDILKAQDEARYALKSGDIEAAFQSINQAKEVIRNLIQSEGVTKSYLSQQAQATAEIADQIVSQEIQNQEAQLTNIQQKITHLKAEADLLKGLKIEFDEGNAIQSVEAIWAVIQKQLLEAPVTLPLVVIPTNDAIDSRVDTLLKPQKKARGGIIIGPGTSMSDSVLAQLSRGEFVVRASAVKHYGAALLNQLNQKQLPKFATGGLVPPRVPLIERSGPSANRQVANLTLNLGSQNFTVSTQNVDVVRELTKAVAREALKSGRRV
ncbi:MAG: hypothetical protein U1E78_11905 [Gammaproteobacteria bacterium]